MDKSMDQNWITEFQADFPGLSDAQAAEAFRSVLHSIRDRLPLNEIASFGSVLPSTLRGEFYGGWAPESRDFSPEFEEDVKRRLGALAPQVNARQAVRSVWNLLGRKLDESTLNQVLHVFPLDQSREMPVSLSA